MYKHAEIQSRVSYIFKSIASGTHVWAKSDNGSDPTDTNSTNFRII